MTWQEQLEKASRDLLDAMDDMHARGETFTARVSVTSARLRALLGGHEQSPRKDSKMAGDWDFEEGEF